MANLLIGMWYIQLVEQNMERRRKRNQRHIQRNLRDRSNPFEMPNALFIKLFRFSKDACLQIIHQIELHMDQRQRNTGIPKLLRILTALHFFGHGSYQVSVGHSFSFALSQPAVSRCVSEVSNIITTHFLHEWIKFPQNNMQKDLIKQGFNLLDYRFTNVIGIIDCTHIKIVSPPAEHLIYPAAPYYCRKGYHSINTQVICDSKKRIININARFPGSVHDSAIWFSSRIKTHLQRGYVNGETYRIFGDSGYPLEPWLLVPFLEPENDPEVRFNRAFCTLRILIEHTIGLLKARFRCTLGHRALHYNPIRAAKIIYTCAVLHNMAIFYRDDLPDEELIAPNNNIPNQEVRNDNDNNWLIQGNRLRRQIVNTYFT